MKLSHLPSLNRSTTTIHLQESECFVRTIQDEHTGETVALVISDPDNEQDDEPEAKLMTNLFVGSHGMMLALGDIVIKADRQHQQLSRLIGTLGESHDLRSALAENVLIRNAARAAIAGVTGETVSLEG